MGQHWERPGESDDWRTPRYVFQALGCSFDTDVAGPCGTHVPADRYIDHDSLSMSWDDFGCVWCNPPFGGTNGIVAWLERFIDHADGIFLCPDATSTGWFHQALAGVDVVLLTRSRIKFLRPDGSRGSKGPTSGHALLGIGLRARAALIRAERNGLGSLVTVTRRPAIYD